MISLAMGGIVYTNRVGFYREDNARKRSRGTDDTASRNSDQHRIPGIWSGVIHPPSGLLSGYACSGSFTRSALAQQSGARTHLTGVFTGLTILAAMLLLDIREPAEYRRAHLPGEELRPLRELLKSAVDLSVEGGCQTPIQAD
jgi:hypothetical protein